MSAGMANVRTESRNLLYLVITCSLHDWDRDCSHPSILLLLELYLDREMMLSTANRIFRSIRYPERWSSYQEKRPLCLEQR